MEVIILLDHDLEGQVAFLKSGLRETGWDRDLHVQFKRLRDFDLPDDCADQEIWRRVQAERILPITNNRNREDETSLQATVDRENAPDSLPILTISDQTRLRLPEIMFTSPVNSPSGPCVGRSPGPGRGGRGVSPRQRRRKPPRRVQP